MNLLHHWWIWAAAGFLFGIVEMMLPGYVFLGFALGAFLVAAILPIGEALGMAGMDVTVLLAIFAAGSLISWLVLRSVFGSRKKNVKIWTRDINDN